MENIYAIENIFCKDRLFIYSKIMIVDYPFYAYIHLNSNNEIDDIGYSIRKVMLEVDIKKLIKRSKIANEQQCSIFKSISMRYWTNFLYEKRKVSTGLYDRHGIEIFEGDDVQCPSFSNQGYMTFTVQYINPVTFYPFDNKEYKKKGYNTNPKCIEVTRTER